MGGRGAVRSAYDRLMVRRALLAMLLVWAATFAGVTGCATRCPCAHAANAPPVTAQVSCAQAVPARADDLSPAPAFTVDECDPPTTRPLAECYLSMHPGAGSTERERRLLIVATWLVGDAERARELARTYAALHPTSPFLRQIALITR